MQFSRYYYLKIFAAVVVAALWVADHGVAAQTAPPARDSSGYRGAYMVGGLPGQANYGYALNRGDTVLQGAFNWEGGSYGLPAATPFERLAYRGNYEGGRPVGPWSIIQGSFQPAGEGSIDGYRYHIDLDGEEWEAAGSLGRGGRLTGKWVHTAATVENGALGQVTYSSEVSFTEGSPERDFRLEDDAETVLLGRFNREGLAQDAWTLYESLAATQTWSFEGGLLTSVSRIRGSDTTSTTVFADPPPATVTVNLDENYLRAIAVNQEVNGRAAAFTTGSAAALLTGNARAYARTAEALAHLGATDTSPTFGVRIPDYQITANQRRRLKRIAEITARARTITQSLLDASSLTLASTADEEVAFAVAAVARLSEDLLSPIATLAEDYRSGVLTVVPLDKYLGYTWPEGAAAGAMQVDYEHAGETKTRAFGGPGVRVFEVAEGGLEEVEALAEYTLAGAQSLQEVLRKTVTSKERRQVVVALEDQLTYEYGLLDSLIRSQDRRTAKRYGLNGIRELAQQEIDSYANLEEGLDEDAQATRAITCLEAFEALTVTLIGLERRQETIENRYTDEVWNNFTSTLMTERIKRRLIDAYVDELVPYFKTSATEGLTCDRAASLHYEITTTHARMAKLRDQDTEDLEDALRDTDDPRAILQLIGVTEPQ